MTQHLVLARGRTLLVTADDGGLPPGVAHLALTHRATHGLQVEQPRRSPDAPWWRDAVVYQVYVRSFADADGDGVGDLPGITARLRVPRRLGVDAVWLTPFYPSPMADHGYDVADYRDVDPRSARWPTSTRCSREATAPASG